MTHGYDVTYVRNITDIDDKIIARANEQKVSIGELTEKYIDEMNQDISALNVLNPSYEPRATQHIDGMIKMISNLIDKGFAYQADNNDVYYSVEKFDGYGIVYLYDCTENFAGCQSPSPHKIWGLGGTD